MGAERYQSAAPVTFQVLLLGHDERTPPEFMVLGIASSIGLPRLFASIARVPADDAAKES